MKHSELPWLNMGMMVTPANPDCGIICKTAERVCEPEWGEARANAKFIVTACNNHYQLLEALNGMLERYTDLVNCGDCGDWNPETDNEVIAAREAIAKAEGEL